MAVQNVLLAESQFAETTPTVIYTSPDPATTLIDKFTATNTSFFPISVTINLVPQGGTRDTENAIVFDYSIPEQSTYLFPELINHFLRAGTSIHVVATLGSSLVIRASGRQIS